MYIQISVRATYDFIKYGWNINDKIEDKLYFTRRYLKTSLVLHQTNEVFLTKLWSFWRWCFVGLLGLLNFSTWSN